MRDAPSMGVLERGAHLHRDRCRGLGSKRALAGALHLEQEPARIQSCDVLEHDIRNAVMLAELIRGAQARVHAARTDERVALERAPAHRVGCGRGQ